MAVVGRFAATTTPDRASRRKAGHDSTHSEATEASIAGLRRERVIVANGTDTDPNATDPTPASASGDETR
ncbi:hypothetical protein C488_17548 [Natrinema pellirubrum DSM 15624]|uniref:Uncharacterized protein n=1 Tax=Natrinema pellirubrum (strain DSM 15624 / CIP 106293 / JCM 10476 / NCIMB 786 / 157) TaxID=797303 RepID=L9YE82_NATP1|nr:hypothetical protein C488_17548 [Natrinema pellirubrum DSM 15624]